MRLKHEFARGATPGAEELRGLYEVRLVTGILPPIRFFGHRKFFPDDVYVENGGAGGYNEFLGRIRIGSFKTGVRDSVLKDGQRVLHINYDRKGNGFLLRPLNDELKRTGDGRYLGRGVFRFGKLTFNSFYFSVVRPAQNGPGQTIGRDNSAGLRVLRGGSGTIFRAIMNAIIPRGGAFGPGAADFDLLPRADRILRSYDPAVRKLFPLILLYVQYGSVPRTGRRFTSLGERAGIRYLGAMEHSPFYHRRMTILILKLITMIVFYDSDENARLTGYEHDRCGLNRGQSS